LLTDYFGTTKKEPRLHVVHPDRNPDNRLYVHSNKTSFSSQKNVLSSDEEINCSAPQQCFICS